MSEAIFHLLLMIAYFALGVEAWKIGHKRMAACYGFAALVTLVFLAGHLPPVITWEPEVWV